MVLVQFGNHLLLALRTVVDHTVAQPQQVGSGFEQLLGCGGFQFVDRYEGAFALLRRKIDVLREGGEVGALVGLGVGALFLHCGDIVGVGAGIDRGLLQEFLKQLHGFHHI